MGGIECSVVEHKGCFVY